jgi:hypothetical protein
MAFVGSVQSAPTKDDLKRIEAQLQKERKTQQENIVNDGEEMKVEENSLENNPTAKRSFKDYVWPIQIRDDRQSEYVWNYNNFKNTPADIERYREHATAIAERYGYKIDFITNEREIPLLATGHRMFSACGILYEKGLRGGADYERYD